MKRWQEHVAGVPVTIYEQAGEGKETVLFLHGVGGTGKMWTTQMRHLHPYGRMLAVDLPGLAGGELPASIRSLSDYAPLFVRLLEQLGVSQAVWVGNSLGGRIALEAAFQAPQRVSGLGLVSSAGIRLPDAPVIQPHSLPPEEFDKLVFYHVERFVRMQSEASRQATLASRAMYQHMMDMTERMDFQDRLAEIDVPTSLIWGRHDGVTPLALGEVLVRGIRGAQLTVIEQAAHVAHVERPQEVNEALSRLMERVVQ